MKRALIAVALVLQLGQAPAAEPLGRLFYTPDQRAQLDVARSQKNRPLPASVQEEAAPVPEVVTYSGMVRRNDGKTTVWINNRAVNDGKAADRLPVPSRVRPDGSINLEVPQTKRSVNLKVGQSIDIVSGTIGEPYARSPVRARPEPKPAAGSAAAKPEGALPLPASKDQDDNERDRR